LKGADLRPLVIAMMDEYVIPDDNRRRFHAVPEDVHFSRRRFAVREIVGLLNEAAVSGAGIPPEQVWLPDPADPAAYDERLETAGGVDLFILASGATDGHVAFLPPGSPPDGSTAIVRLAETTRRDNLTTFPGFLSLDDVPTHGVSVGLGTIRRLSRRIRLIIHG
jgi:glucosamine-6-phosphate deaminase